MNHISNEEIELTKKSVKVIMLSGKANSGKDTVADYMIEHFGSEKKVVKMPIAENLKDYLYKHFDWDGEKDIKSRDFLQQVGTERIRDELNYPDFHINRVFEDIVILRNKLDYVFIPDLRFENEAQYLIDKFGDSVTLIHVVREDIEDITKLNDEQLNHRSENALGDTEHDYIIENDGSIWDLYIKVDEVIKQL